MYKFQMLRKIKFFVRNLLQINLFDLKSVTLYIMRYYYEKFLW